MARIDTNAAEMAAIGAQAGGEVFYELGMLYACGRSVPTDLVAAHKWLNIAVFRGCKQAVERRAELAREMSQSDVAAAQREARLWLTRH